jgi:adenosylcobinamide-phosphate synthase
MLTAAATALALLLDAWLGEPRRFHPLVGFGRLADRLEARLNDGRRWRGLLALLLLLIPAALVAWALASLPQLGFVIELVVLYLAVGRTSLVQHAQAVAAALRAQDLPRARTCVGMIVSRDTAEMEQTDIAKATVESMLENGSDAIFGALFWFAVAGAPGVVVYRLANTLDAMWGYKTPRFVQFGWAAARFDDLLNLVPARLTALSYGLVGHLGSALRCWRRQAAAWESPNAGPVMAAGAGALELRLGGGARYHGGWKERPPLGAGRLPQAGDIDRAVGLVNRSTLLWLAVIVLGGWALA